MVQLDLLTYSSKEIESNSTGEKLREISKLCRNWLDKYNNQNWLTLYIS